ncbi:TetR/AcrR family transcriptional regulator [Leucobacter sp. PH1c]|uniref:TetR/AcrR family transcriptional regulator n=1 Tax=Leucobacter sp. PH1c TaxID=1397278 RepID=UPI0004697D39|nr:TetR family transcriptional regulator [Leucobacter sp. PH1c]
MPDPGPFHVGLTPAAVVAAAAELTRESHLMSWSIRDLAKRLGVAPSVVYHHVGGKELLCRRVVEHMLTGVVAPAHELAWQDWFRELLLSAGPVAGAYPGTAKWMLMHGPVLPGALPILETGIERLRAGGFGDRANLAYALLLNTAMLTISLSDDRLQHEDDGPRDHAALMAELHGIPSASPSLRGMADDLVAPFAAGGQRAEQMRWEYYRAVVETTIAGLAATR